MSTVPQWYPLPAACACCRDPPFCHPPLHVTPAALSSLLPNLLLLRVWGLCCAYRNALGNTRVVPASQWQQGGLMIVAVVGPETHSNTVRTGPDPVILNDVPAGVNCNSSESTGAPRSFCNQSGLGSGLNDTHPPATYNKLHELTNWLLSTLMTGRETENELVQCNTDAQS